MRGDPGLQNLHGNYTPSLQFMQNGRTSASALVRARVQKPEEPLPRLEGVVQTHAQYVVAMATGFARTDKRVYMQNTVTAAIHMAKSVVNGRTDCGWPCALARKCGPGLPYRTAESLV